LQTVRAEGRPVLLEFTADWCINCKVLERTVYADPEVAAQAAAQDVAALQVDLTRGADSARQLLRRMGGAGIPFAVLVRADGTVAARFYDLFSSQRLLNALHQMAEEVS